MTAVTPGQVCAHHHLYSALARGMPAPPKTATTFLEVLEQIWWRLDSALDLEMIRWSAMLGALEALEQGTTAIIDHHESPNAIEGSLDVIAEACAAVGVRVVCAYGVTDRHGADGARRGLEENRRFISGGGRGLVGIHATFTCEDETLAAAAALATELGAGVHIHVAEGAEDIDAPQKLAGLTRSEWLLAHCVHLPTDHDLQGTILHNPRSNLNNAVGYANPARFSNPVALGTDGIGANMIESFRLAYVMHRSVDVTATPKPISAEAVRETAPSERVPASDEHKPAVSPNSPQTPSPLQDPGLLTLITKLTFATGIIVAVIGVILIIVGGANSDS